MIRGVKADHKNKGNKPKGSLLRSKSKSRSRSPVNNKQKKLPATSRGKKDNNKRNRSPSIARSKSKKDIKKSQSSKKIKRNVSQPKMNNNSKLKSSPSARNQGRFGSPAKKLHAKNESSLASSPRKVEPTIKQ